MKECPLESNVLAGKDLEHAAHCPHCQGVLRLQQSLLADSRSLAAKAKLPSVGSIVWRGQLRLERKKTDRACSPVYLMEGLGFLAAILWLAWTVEGEFAVAWRTFIGAIVFTLVLVWMIPYRRLRKSHP